MPTELQFTARSASSSCLRPTESPVAFTGLDVTPERADLDLDFWTGSGARSRRGVQTQGSLSSYELT
jgi:hypothetical protein